MVPLVFLLATAWVAHIVPVIGFVPDEEALLVARSNLLPLICNISSIQ
jgi:hypothetical protein